MISALLDLYENLSHTDSLKWAIDLQAVMDSEFYDPEHGGYFVVTKDDPSLILRMKEDYDGAEPSPTSYALQNLLRLYYITQNEDYKKRAEKMISLHRKEALSTPIMFPHFISALDLFFEEPTEITLFSPSPNEDFILDNVTTINSDFLPNKIITYADNGESQNFLASLSVTHNPTTTKSYIQICQNKTCQIANTTDEVVSILGYKK